MKVQEVILRAIAKRITWWQAAEIIGISDRQMRRWRRRWEKFGYDGLLDRRRGRPSLRRVPLELAERVLGLYREKYFDFNVCHFQEKLREQHGIALSYTWVKLALQGAGLVRKRGRRGVHRRRRPRRPLPGMLLHLDGSSHRWLGEGRRYDLLVVLDDATSEIYYAQLVEEESTRTVLAALREVVAGDACLNCGHGLEVERGIEVGHIFKLGYKYSDALDIRVSGPDGKPVKPIMGCYGIGVERAMATAVEVHHDDKGIIWPVAIAPFEIVVVIAQQEDAAVAAAGEQVYQALLDSGAEVIVDDRKVRAGVKFSDAELTGIPFRVTVGKRGLAAGTAELTDRAAGSTVAIPLDEVAKHVREAVAGA